MVDNITVRRIDLTKNSLLLYTVGLVKVWLLCNNEHFVSTYSHSYSRTHTHTVSLSLSLSN